MRANELMIDDWVKSLKEDHSGEYGQVIDIDHHDTVLLEYQCVNYYTDVEHIEPIPITPEILTANGFEKKENHSGCHYANYIEHSPVYAEQTIGDFTAMPFPDGSFKMVVFDPPHLVWAGKTANLYKRFGKLDKDWKTELTMGFKECFRVLEPYGVLIFK